MIRKPIENYPGYEISEFGDVRTIDRVVSVNGKSRRVKSRRVKSRMLSKRYIKSGRSRVRLSKNGKDYEFFTHRVVAATFIGPIDGFIVDHIDDNYRNNNYTNLQIITQTNNMLKKEIKVFEIKTLLSKLYKKYDKLPSEDEFIKNGLDLFFNM